MPDPRDDIGKLQWTLDNIYTVARREANRASPHPKWALVLRLCEAVGCRPRGVLKGTVDADSLQQGLHPHDD